MSFTVAAWVFLAAIVLMSAACFFVLIFGGDPEGRTDNWLLAGIAVAITAFLVATGALGWIVYLLFVTGGEP